MGWLWRGVLRPFCGLVLLLVDNYQRAPTKHQHGAFVAVLGLFDGRGCWLAGAVWGCGVVVCSFRIATTARRAAGWRVRGVAWLWLKCFKGAGAGGGGMMWYKHSISEKKSKNPKKKKFKKEKNQF